MNFPKSTLAIVATLVAGLAVSAQPGAAARRVSRVKGGSGVISTYGVGSHHFEHSTPASIRSFARRPDSVVYWNKLGQPTGPRHAVWEIWKYNFSGGQYVQYSFHRKKGRWVFVQIDTNRKNFSTVRGTRVGMTYGQAQSRERVPFMGGCIDSGFWHFRQRHRYAYIVGVLSGQRVHALHAYGPHPLPC